MRDRNLRWDGCLNVRDLGGHPTENGGETRFGAVVRGDSARKLTEKGWKAAADYGIRTIVDLRLHSELAEDASAAPVEVVHISLVPDVDSPDWPEIDAIGEAAGKGAARTRAVYLEFLERYRPKFGEAITAVATAPEGGVLVHCLGGKDRTGLVSALLLRLAGVGIEEIAADYAASAENLRSMLDAWVAGAESEREREQRSQIALTPAEAMVGVLEEIEQRYGSVDAYLRGAGVADAVLERARARLVASP